MTSSTQSREAKRYENLLVIVLFLAFGFVFFDRQAVPFLFPFISQEIGLNNTQLGIITGVLAVSWALSGAAVGKFSDKRSPSTSRTSNKSLRWSQKPLERWAGSTS